MAAQERPADTDAEAARQIEEVCNQITGLRKRPLLLLYYPGPYGEMAGSDVCDTYRAFRAANIIVGGQLAECDVLVHTFGGDPLAGYRLAQVIHDFAGEVTFLVPEHAYSAGTLLCFSGNRIRLGHYAGLSPIDITQEDIELTSIDYFLEFANDCEEKVQKIFTQRKQNPTDVTVASDLLCQLVQEVGALKVGEYYRARTLTGHYAQELLDSYMLRNLPNKIGRRNKIIRELLFEAPAHEYHLDFHICMGLGLIIEEMDTRESDLTKSIVTLLDSLAQRGVICQNISDEEKMPFIAFYPRFEGGVSNER